MTAPRITVRSERRPRGYVAAGFRGFDIQGSVAGAKPSDVAHVRFERTTRVWYWYTMGSQGLPIPPTNSLLWLDAQGGPRSWTSAEAALAVARTYVRRWVRVCYGALTPAQTEAMRVAWQRGDCQLLRLGGGSWSYRGVATVDAEGTPAWCITMVTMRALQRIGAMVLVAAPVLGGPSTASLTPIGRQRALRIVQELNYAQAPDVS